MAAAYINHKFQLKQFNWLPFNRFKALHGMICYDGYINSDTLL